MRRIIFLSLILTLMILSACDAFPGTGSQGEIVPTRLSIPTATPGDNAVQPQQPASPHQAAWFINPAERTILGVDPISHVVVVKVLTTFDPSLVSVTPDSVWAVEVIDDKLTSLLQLDILSQSVTENIPIQYGRVTSISASGRYVWLTVDIKNNDSPEPKGGVVQVDAVTHTVYRFYQTSAYPLQVVADGQTAWVLEQAVLNTYFDRIDAASGEIKSLPSPINDINDLQYFGRFTVHNSGIWAIPQQAQAAYVFWLDPLTGKIKEKIQVGESASQHPIDIVSNDSTIFLALKDNTIVSFSPERRAIGNPVSISTPISGLSTTENAIWAWSYAASTAYQIDVVTHTISGSTSLGATPAPTPAPTFYPTIPVIGVNKPCDGVDFESQLRPGMRAIVNPDPPVPNRVREKPTKTSTVIDVVNANHWVDILEGPACAEGRVWWRVHTQNNLYGWTPEGDGIDHWLIASPENKSE